MKTLFRWTLSGLLAAGCALPAWAQPIQVYTSRPAWTAVVPVHLIEDFEQDTPQTGLWLPPGYATGRHAFGLDAPLGAVEVDIQSNSPAHFNGSQILKVMRDVGGGMTVTFPLALPASAFGFDYFTDDPHPWTLDVYQGGALVATQQLDRFASSFIGFTGLPPGVNAFTVWHWAPHSPGLSVDNISLPVPEPASLALFSTGLLGLLGLARRRLVAT